MLRRALLASKPLRFALRSQRCFATYPPHEVVGLPALSPTMEQGTLSEWLMKEGDLITPGDIICKVETDKAVVDFEAQDEMYLAKILIQAGTENINVGQPIMVTCDEEEYLPALKEFKLDESHTVPAPKALAPEEKPPKKEEVIVDKEKGTPVAPADFLVMPQTPQKIVKGPAIPAPLPSAAPSKPVASPVATAAPVAGFSGDKWGLGLRKSPISFSLAKKQQAYLDLYGITGTIPVSTSSDK